MKLRFTSLALSAAAIVATSVSSASAQSFICQESDGAAHGGGDNQGGAAKHGGSEFLEVSDDLLGYTLAESTTLQAGQVVDTVSWEGAYIDYFYGLTSCAPADDFRLTVYEDDGSGTAPDPSSIVATFALGSSVNRTLTGEMVPAIVPKDVYEYSAQLTPALSIASTGIYWFEIANNTPPPDPNQCAWAWRTAPPGDGLSALQPNVAAWFGTHEFDLDLCLSGYTHLAGDVPAISLSAGGSQVLTLNAGPSRANWHYWIFGSVLGTSPGLDFGGGLILPLNYGPYFKITLEKPHLGAFGNFLSQLDAQGEATASLSLPPGLDPGLAGVTINHAYLATSVIGIPDFASNAVPVLLVP